MDKKFEGKPVVRDIEICRKCSWFRGVDGEDGYDKQGIYCRNYHSMSNSTWCAETPHAVTEEEFVRAKNTMLIKTNAYSRKNNRS